MTGETTILVYDAGGALAAEYSTIAPTNPTTSYLTTDHLGSPRVITDVSGQVISRRDFMPFGEELGAGVGGRTQALKYSYLGSDNIRQRFTGYEKDDETGLDFAEARMYQNKHGRFTAPDPLLTSASAADPQTFNRYTYTGNDPVNYNDPSGLNWCRQSGGATQFTGEGVVCDTANGWEDADRSVVTITSGDWSKEKAKVGDTVILNANGSVTVVNSPEARAIAQGQSVVNATVEVSGQTAAGAAASGSGQVSAGDTSISGTISTPGLLTLPCPPEVSSCGSGNIPFISLDTSHNPGLKSVEGIALVAETGSLLPVVGVPFAIIAATIRLGQGNLGSAGSNLAMVVPLGGLTKLGKGGRIAEEIVEDSVKHSDDLVKAAQELYPKLAGKIQLHHIIPKYLGGAKNGALAPLDAAYHQMITNAFRKAWGYGSKQTPNAAELKKIMDKVYREFPLPPGYKY